MQHPPEVMQVLRSFRQIYAAVRLNYKAVDPETGIGTAQLWNSTQYSFTQRTTLFQFPMHQVSNHFGVGFRNKGIATRFQQLTQWFMVFNDAVMHHNNVFRNMGMRVRF